MRCTRTTASTPRRWWGRRWTSCEAALLVALALAVTGCGSDEDDGGSPAASTQTQTQERKGPSDATQVRVLGTKYLKAFAKADWKAVCATVSPHTRAWIARKFGSCVKLYESTPRAAIRLAKYQTVLAVKVRGDRATITIGTYAETGPEERMHAGKLDGRWWFYDKRAAKGAP